MNVNMSSVKPIVLIKSLEEADTHIVTWITRKYSELFRGQFRITDISEVTTNSELVSEVRGIFMYALDGDVFLELMPSLTNLKAIMCLGSGYDTYYPLYKPFGIPIAHGPHVLTDAVANFNMGLILNAGHHISQGAKMLGQFTGKVDMSMAADIPGVDETTLGIVGLGRIGQRLAERARAFNMKVLYHKRHQLSNAEENHLGVQYYPNLHDMLPECDYVALLCPLTPSTRHLIGTEEFKLMKSRAMLINTSRGAVIDSDALVTALTLGYINFAALDVSDPEPLPEGHPLLGLDNVLITPHIAWCSRGAVDKHAHTAFDNLKSALIDGKPMNCIINE